MKLFYIGLYLKERILWKNYGFTSYVDLYTEAETPEAAKAFAKKYFEDKFKVEVEKVKVPTVTQSRFVDPSEIVLPTPKQIQTNIFLISNTTLK